MFLNSNVLYFPVSSGAFNISLIFALNIRICTLFQPVRLQVFCILTITIIMANLQNNSSLIGQEEYNVVRIVLLVSIM